MTEQEERNGRVKGSLAVEVGEVSDPAVTEAHDLSAPHRTATASFALAAS